MRYPISGPITITTKHGQAGWGRFNKHTGIDIRASTGTPVYAPTSGTVRYSTYGPSGGNQIEIFDGKFYHRLMHHSRNLVKSGQRVTEGQKIALAGATGKVTGSHSHWDVRTNVSYTRSFNDFVDPVTLIKEDDVKVTKTIAGWLYNDLLQRNPDRGGLSTYVGKRFYDVYSAIRSSGERARVVKRERQQDEVRERQSKIIDDLTGEVAKLKGIKVKSQAELDAKIKKIDQLTNELNLAEATIKELKQPDPVEPPHSEDPAPEPIESLIKKIVDRLIGLFK